MNDQGTETLIGKLSGKPISIPSVDAPPMPALADPGIIHDGKPADGFRLDSSIGYPDVRSFRRKFGLIIPATNTSMEHELWSGNAHAERFVRWVREECLDRLIPLGERRLRGALAEYLVHYHRDATL